MKNVTSLVVGFIFAVGLGLSGMTSPEKVIGFLDVFGNWDPSLMFVMMGAIGVHFFSYRLIRRRPSPLLTKDWDIPTKTEITKSLVAGAFIFGVGWGLAGYCPGPAIVSLASFDTKVIWFVEGMLIGILAYKRALRFLKPS